MSLPPLLKVRDLRVQFETPRGVVRAVNGVSFDVFPGEILGVVGESGSGKSVSMLALTRLLSQPPARILSGSVEFQGSDLLSMPSSALAAVRGRDIAYVFQDPMTSLNPLKRVGWQIMEGIRVHNPELSREQLRSRAIDLLEEVEIADAERRVTQYPHEFSGGMRQRAMIAIAMANRPKLLIADEPTTALDVTIQAQVLSVLKHVQEATQAATVLITHDLGLVADLADRVVVMYGGRIVEQGPARVVMRHPQHPYTSGLLASLPRLRAEIGRLEAIPGQPPDPIDLPTGCAFHPRCRLGEGRELCRLENPGLRELQPAHQARCHFSEEMYGPASRSGAPDAEPGAPSAQSARTDANRHSP